MTNLSKQPKAIVLWGNYFDEAMAITFIAALRQGSVGTELVGIHGRAVSGRSGVALVVDLTLSDAYPFAQEAAIIIIPSHSPTTGILANDPRILRFLGMAHANGASIVTGQLSPTDAELLPMPIHRIEIVEHLSDYGAIATELCHQLQQQE